MNYKIFNNIKKIIKKGIDKIIKHIYNIIISERDIHKNEK